MPSALRTLLDQAIRLPPGAPEFTGPDDVRYRVRRADDSDSIRLDPVLDSIDARTIVWTCADTRPDLYPDDLPFIASTDTVAVLTSAGRSCTWSADERAGHVGTPRDGSLDAMLELRPSEHVTRALQDIWSAALDQSVTAGWTVIDEATSDFPFPIRTAVLHRANRRRKIDRGGVMGLPVVTLNETDDA